MVYCSKRNETGMYSIMFHSELRADMHLLNVEQSIEISGIPEGITDPLIFKFLISIS